jgi:hypothetical protein
MFWEAGGEFCETEIRVVKGMDEPAHHIHALPQHRLEPAQSQSRDVTAPERIVNASGQQSGQWRVEV